MLQHNNTTTQHNTTQHRNLGTLTRFELHNAIVELTGKEYSMDQVETLYEEFDNDHSGYVDILEFKALLSYFETKNSTHKREKSVSDRTE